MDQLLFLLAHLILHKNSRTPTVQKRENSNRKAGAASLWKRNKLHNKTLKVPFIWDYLKYLAPEITTSPHKQQRKYPLQMNVFFYLNKAEEAENVFSWFSDP